MRNVYMSFLGVIHNPYTIPPLILQSRLASGDVSTVNKIKLSLSIYLHLLFFCLSFSLSFWQSRLIANVSQSALLYAVNLAGWQTSLLCYLHTDTHKYNAHTHPFKGISERCIFKCNFNQWHLKVLHSSQNACGLRLHKTVTNCTYEDLSFSNLITI